MRLPEYHEMFTPILEILPRDGEMSNKELEASIKEHYSHLSDELLNKKTTTKISVLTSRFRWGKYYLKLGGFIDYPSKKIVKITQKGKEALEERGEVVWEDITNSPGYISYYGDKKTKRRRTVAGNETDIESISLQTQHDLSSHSPQDLIDEGFPEIEKQTKSDLLDKLANIDPYSFERVILSLLEKMGYGIPIETPKSGDGGIDGIIDEDQLGLEKIYMQAKRYDRNNKVREKEIRDFIGAMSGKTSKGVFVTTSSFDDKAKEKAKESDKRIILIDGSKLADLMYQHDVGVQIRKTYVVKKIDEDFFEED